MSIFDDIYRGNGWGFGSGHGSLPSVTKGYRAFLEMFIRENNVSSVVDYGCGDWQFSRLINWGASRYIGLDIVPSVIAANTQKYGNDLIRFKTITPATTKLPKSDLLISKDVLQHLSEADIQRFLTQIVPNYRFCLLTNCIIPRADVNRSIQTGEFRPLDLRAAPYNQHSAVVYSFVGPRTYSRSERKFFPAWKKHTLLITGS